MLLTTEREPSFEEQLEAQRGALLRYALRLTGGRVQDSEDLVQDSLIAAWEHKASWRPAQTGAWLRRILLNRVRNQYRIDKARATTTCATEELDCHGAPESAVVLAPEQVSMLGDELGDELAVALQAIPPCYAEAVVLRGVYDYSTSEMMQLLGLSQGTVNSRIARGRALLRQLLAGLSH
jgi:RNA polymerase sigma-70 factor (ECF subfamily)